MWAHHQQYLEEQQQQQQQHLSQLTQQQQRSQQYHHQQYYQRQIVGNPIQVPALKQLQNQTTVGFTQMGHGNIDKMTLY